jgi:hypothetical protein
LASSVAESQNFTLALNVTSDYAAACSASANVQVSAIQFPSGSLAPLGSMPCGSVVLPVALPGRGAVGYELVWAAEAAHADAA